MYTEKSRLVIANRKGVYRMRKWIKHVDPNNKYSATYTLGNRDIVLPPEAVISVTRGEQLSMTRLVINGIINQFVMKALTKKEDLLYAELTGQMQGGIGQTLTVWKDMKRMNSFRTTGSHQFARKWFGWVFYRGRVQSYFLTRPHQGTIPSAQEMEKEVKEHGRQFKGGQLVKKATPPQLRSK